MKFLIDLRVQFENNSVEKYIRRMKLQHKMQGTFRTTQEVAAFFRI